MSFALKRVQPDNRHLIPALTRVLQAVVDGGASVGFLAPLAESEAAEYWRNAFSELSDERLLWVAESGGEVAGTVQLAPCMKANGRHRAEIQKLLVHPKHRRQNIASRLMAEAESTAKSLSCTLLVLDTESKSAAEIVYQRLGWTACGGVPGFALGAGGMPRDNVYYYKQLVP